MRIVGITGTIGAGKGTIVEYLNGKGFEHLSVRKYLEEKLAEEGKELNRENMVVLANTLRGKYGPAYIAEELYKQAEKSGRDIIIESIRNPGEVKNLKDRGKFSLFSVDAEPKVRYERIKIRGTGTDRISFSEFLKQEKKEMASTEKYAQNIKACMEMADYRFDNNGTFEQLYKQVDDVLGKMKPAEEVKEDRPSWDDYFMEVVHAIAKRGTCDRGRVGTVIAKDKQILTSGYVGSPIGFPHCDEIGHMMKKMLHEDGSISQHCVRTVHSEQNAICQAAKRGISIDGATLYTMMTPCRVCAMLIINSGIKRVYCEKIYHAGAESEEMFKKAGILCEYKYNELLQYKNQ